MEQTDKLMFRAILQVIIVFVLTMIVLAACYILKVKYHPLIGFFMAVWLVSAYGYIVTKYARDLYKS